MRKLWFYNIRYVSRINSFLLAETYQDRKTKQQCRTRQRVQSYCGFTTTRRKRCFQVGDNAKISVRPKDTVDPGKITNGGPIRGRLYIKTTQVPPFAVFQYSSPSFPYITHFPLQIFHTCAKICRSANHRCIFICIYIYIFFLVFVCMKGYPSSDSGPSKEIS